MGHWFVRTLKLDVDFQVIAMHGWQPDAAPGHGWPLLERNWINPSPNAPNLSMARCYAGTVMLEGATLSEGRGTTRPLELFGAPDLEPRKIIATMQQLAPTGCTAASCANAGSNRLSTNTPANSAPASRFTSKPAPTITPHSNPGACKRWHSRQSACCSRTMPCGATFPMNTKTTAWPST
jgi:hypothetical protein